MKILMVCLGNICRSPLAHGILEKEIKKLKLDWTVDSAGTSAYHIGDPPDRRAIEIAKSNGIDIKNQRSRELRTQDLQDFDLIITMDTNNYNNVQKLAQSQEEKNKVKLLLNYSFPNENRAVPDPYYSGGFDYVFELITDAILSMVSQLNSR